MEEMEENEINSRIKSLKISPEDADRFIKKYNSTISRRIINPGTPPIELFGFLFDSTDIIECATGLELVKKPLKDFGIYFGINDQTNNLTLICIKYNVDEETQPPTRTPITARMFEYCDPEIKAITLPI